MYNNDIYFFTFLYHPSQFRASRNFTHGRANELNNDFDIFLCERGNRIFVANITSSLSTPLNYSRLSIVAKRYERTNDVLTCH